MFLVEVGEVRIFFLCVCSIDLCKPTLPNTIKFVVLATAALGLL